VPKKTPFSLVHRVLSVEHPEFSIEHPASSKFFPKKVLFLLNIPPRFGIIIIAIEMAVDGGQVAREKPIFWQKNQCFEHFWGINDK